MIPQVFLSLSGKDDDFVEKVWYHLPDGLALFYRQAFENGQQLLEAMETGIDQSSLFVFFASKDSIASCWVSFELDQARLARIKRPNFRILVFPISDDVTASMLPAWMQQYWISKAGWGPKDIARYVRRLLTSAPIASAALSGPVFGRGQLLDTATQRLMVSVADTHAMPNVIIFAGLAGIGRRTFAHHFVKQALPALPNLSIGPEFQLPQFADLADLYRSLREQIETSFSLSSFENDLNIFNEMSVDEQIAEIVKSIGYFANLGQAVFVSAGSGLLEDRGTVKIWVGLLFKALSLLPHLRIYFISNRQLREEEIQNWPNVIHFHVPPLKDADVRALMTATSTIYGIKPVSPSDGIVRAIGGHAQTAKAAVRVLAQKGDLYFDNKPSALFSIQEEILSENLEVEALTDLQKEILCILSWVPQLDGKLLETVVASRNNIDRTTFIETLDDLIMGCLVLVSESSFMISSAIRQMFRRKHGYGPEGLLKSFSNSLREAWLKSQEIGEFRTELFDAFVFMHALEGKSLPNELRSLLLPSTLHEVIRETYAQGRDDDDTEAFRRVISWGAIVEHMKMDENVREEILSTVVRAYVRLSEYENAEEVLREFARKGYRSTSYLRGFAKRRQGKYREALPLLKEALAIRKYDGVIVQEIATCYQKLGMQNELLALVREHEDVVERSAVLLDFRIGALVAAREFKEAEAAIRRLRLLGEDEGRAAIREAQILIQRDRKFEQAEGLLTNLLQHNVGRIVTVRRWRAMAALGAGHLELARQDIEFIRGRRGNQDIAQRLEVYFAIANADYEGAEKIRASLPVSASNNLLKARILDARSYDPRTPLQERSPLREQALTLRNQHKLVMEFDFD